MKPIEPRKQRIIDCLHEWVNQRPVLEYRDYASVDAYHADARAVSNDLETARLFLRDVAKIDAITADDIIDAARHAYSGRLVINSCPHDVTIEYCAGQYWPTEYRRAVCAVLASALWKWKRDRCMPDGIERGTDWLRKSFARKYGRGIARAWFQ